MLNIEKGEGGIGRIQCNLIETKGKSTDYSKFVMSVSTILHGIVLFLKAQTKAQAFHSIKLALTSQLVLYGERWTSPLVELASQVTFSISLL